MGRLYNHKKIESKWQKKWEKGKDFEAREDVGAKKFYSLIEFPYPSGEGLHVGHIRSNTAMDIVARKRRAQRYSFFYTPDLFQKALKKSTASTYSMQGQWCLFHVTSQKKSQAP